MPKQRVSHDNYLEPLPENYNRIVRDDEDLANFFENPIYKENVYEEDFWADP